MKLKALWKLLIIAVIVLLAVKVISVVVNINLISKFKRAEMSFSNEYSSVEALRHMFEYSDENRLWATGVYDWVLTRLIQKINLVTDEYLAFDCDTIDGFEQLKELHDDVDFLIEINGEAQDERLLNLKSTSKGRWLREVELRALAFKDNMKWYTSVSKFESDIGLSYYLSRSEYLNKENFQELETILSELDKHREYLEKVAIAEAQYHKYSDLLRNPPNVNTAPLKIRCLGKVVEDLGIGFVLEISSFNGEFIEARHYHVSSPRIIVGDIVEIIGTYEYMSEYEEIGKKPYNITVVIVDTMRIVKAR